MFPMKFETSICYTIVAGLDDQPLTWENMCKSGVPTQTVPPSGGSLSTTIPLVHVSTTSRLWVNVSKWTSVAFA